MGINRIGRNDACGPHKSEMKTYEGVGHLPMEEDPEAFNADVIAFLQTIEE